MSSRILAVGDVVGEEATAWLAERLPALRADHAIDWIIVNAENCTVTGPSPMNGFGIGSAAVDLLSSAGVDVITGGNHSWDGEETAVALERPTVVRPWNVDHQLGRGIVTLEHAGSVLTVVNLLSPSAMLPGASVPQPRKIWPSWCELRSRHELAGAVVIDLHGESAWEKMSFAAAVDGTVTAVVGTHTHDPSLRGHILPRGTGYITELGMTGRLGFTGGGFNPAHFAANLRGEDLTALPPFELASGAMTVGAVLITADDSHRVTRIARLQMGEDHLQLLPARSIPIGAAAEDSR